MSLVLATVKRDFLLAARNPGEWLNPLMFFLMVAALFPLAVDPDPKFLGKIAGGVIWVAALLATLLSLDALFKADVEDGSLEQWLASGESLYAMALGKALVHWCISGLPLTIMSPVLALMLNMPNEAYGALILSLAVGTPVLSLLGAVGAALTAGVRSGGLLLSLLILPLYIPVLIFAASAVYSAGIGMDFNGQLGFLGAILALAMCLTPFAVAAALKLNLSR
ncbi:heme exporter protein CcmB [Bacterioplanoides sp. SCSIO 12839]|uniref:heme exporter protein CcmB n=1 Tax=Bacterioplanoides sp. SCSIO 12839 TaxID=2829569 RepID=UPI002103CA82|nr:heme exporter protein CcmB [Bacterioplanoides sp. SCSIO 12839]UTW49687.1 heme exporter protein CcmB [Bacterioplanoides sp. SCSIO 12839]